MQFGEIFRSVPAEGEGLRLVKDTFSYLVGQKRYLDVLDLLFQSGAKFLGYQLGKRYQFIPHNLLLSCTSNASYFDKGEICAVEPGNSEPDYEGADDIPLPPPHRQCHNLPRSALMQL